AVCCRNRPASAPVLGPPGRRIPFFGPSRVHVGADEGGVEDELVQVRFAAQGSGDASPDSRLRPAAEAPERAVPGPEPLGQMAPGCSRLRHPQDSVDEEPILGATTARRQQALDQCPLVIGNRMATHHGGPPWQTRRSVLYQNHLPYVHTT